MAAALLLALAFTLLSGQGACAAGKSGVLGPGWGHGLKVSLRFRGLGGSLLGLEAWRLWRSNSGCG
jgi:hypothetical protein